jgi:hypothetical protein
MRTIVFATPANVRCPLANIRVFAIAISRVVTWRVTGRDQLKRKGNSMTDDYQVESAVVAQDVAEAIRTLNHLTV